MLVSFTTPSADRILTKPPRKQPKSVFAKCAGVCAWSKRLCVSLSKCRYLFHGTRNAAALNICRNDFKMRLAGSSTGTLYGRGAYFAESITKAAVFCLTRVLLAPLLLSTDVGVLSLRFSAIGVVLCLGSRRFFLSADVISVVSSHLRVELCPSVVCFSLCSCMGFLFRLTVFQNRHFRVSLVPSSQLLLCFTDCSAKITFEVAFEIM